MVHGRCHHLPDGRRISDGSGLQRTIHPDFISGRSSVCHSGRDLSSWAEQEQITMVFSNNNYLEIFPSASGKGAAVRKLCELLNISPLLSIAAGDAENDISMIEAAGIGIAMYNASDDVKAAATMVTALDNNHDGLARELLDLV